MHTFNEYPYCDRALLNPHDPTKYDAVVLGVPSEMTATTAGGQRGGPSAIRDGYHDDYDYTVWSSTRQLIVDMGDVNVVSGDMAKTGENIRKDVYLAGMCSNLGVILGGDDGINYWVAHAFDDMCQIRSSKRKVLIHFDAHADVYTNPKGETDHATWVRDAIRDGHIDQAYLFGVRAQGVELVDEKILISSSMANLPVVLRLEHAAEIMLGLDLDVVDPAFAPGVAVHEPLGISPSELSVGIELAASRASLFSITEMVPGNDINGVTAMLANRIAWRAIHWRKTALQAPRKKNLPGAH